uniref:Intraflagellar transport 27 homolog (Chlamydomonas) n=1 Tax=Sphaeramia orbicularis TaxID=375764 RepID=A0A672ZEI4_9TELE
MSAKYQLFFFFLLNQCLYWKYYDILPSGKTTLSHMFNSDGSLFQKNYSMVRTSDELYILDSAGKETLVEACEKMWGRPSLLCLVFDLTSQQSFTNCTNWMDKVLAHCQGLRVPGVLVGNKSDLSARREVDRSVAQDWAQSQGLDYHETSAKEVENCDGPLVSLARAFHSLYHQHCETTHSLGPG